MIDHASREHAVLSASGSDRWMQCPPSALINAHAEREDTHYSLEGTLAHELSELKARRLLTPVNEKARTEIARNIDELKKSKYYNADMDDHTNAFVDYVAERFLAAKKLDKNTRIHFEIRVDYSEVAPHGRGTCDVVIVCNQYVEVIDLKYGQGVAVSAVDNPQLRLYALGAVREYELVYDFDHVVYTIVQPRLDSITSERMSVEELVGWAYENVKPKADLAINGEGDFNAGSHCKFCSFRFRCAERTRHVLELTGIDKDAMLDDKQLADAYGRVGVVQSWVYDIKDYSLKYVIEGGKLDGYKLVAGKSKRYIKDEAALRGKLESEGYDEGQYLRIGFVPLSDLEKMVGKKKLANEYAAFFGKSNAAPTLAPESDKRPALGNDFDDDFNY